MKRKRNAEDKEPTVESTIKNRPLHIPLGFEAAVGGLLNTQPKHRKPDKPKD